MAIYTGSLDYAATLLGETVARDLTPVDPGDREVPPVIRAILGGEEDLYATASHLGPWRHILISEFSPRSQYDQLIDLAREEQELPDRIACVAGSGLGFHGFKGRPWAARPGNIHLSVHLAPARPIERFHVAFTVLAAVSVVDALDGIPGLENRAQIKWVNDVLFGPRKAAGILAYTQTRNITVTSAVLGIGVNVENTPPVEPTPFVPSATSVREVGPGMGEDLQHRVFSHLLRAVDNNYSTLLSDGVGPLLRRYRERVAGLGEHVKICSEDSENSFRVLAAGRFIELGENLELYLEGQPHPISRGRMMLGSVTSVEPSPREEPVGASFWRPDSGAGGASCVSTPLGKSPSE